MTFKAVIFDLDGTLLDTLQDLADAMNSVLQRRGYPLHPPEAYKLFIGHGFPTLASRCLPEAARLPAIIAECVAEAKAEYDKRWMRNTRPYAGVPELLSETARRRVKQAILSNKPHEFTVTMVAHFFAAWDFEAVIGGREGVPGKPDPAGALEISATLGFPPGDVLYVGDSGTDMATARNAGMRPVGVLWGFRGREELLENGAEWLVSRPADLLAWF